MPRRRDSTEPGEAELAARAAAERREERVHAVLDVVDAIPAGRVMTYGDIARYLGIPSARQVGQIMARSGHEVPWQRVVMADGAPASHDPARHLARLRADHTPLRHGRVDLGVARWRPDQAGPGQPGPGQAGPGQRGPDQPGPDRPGPGQAGPDQPGPDQPDPGHTDPGHTDPGPRRSPRR